MKNKETWFPAKENGLGWGKPTTWQGWLVLSLYLFVLCLISILVDPKEALMAWAFWVACDTFVLLLICYLKGESPSWKWKPIEKEKRKWFK
ncbi:hypothetical protein [Marinomonas sp. TW1]|uniref:hypothetical protein n=1 Tax=Marinomonas sp. TW1 TaxID=1561203 RepID=UPI0007AEF967|nr:hypothetical protein [Marinomonas sp. TW1]KZN14554.1 hypothetical protein OA79_04540 [Marinomonas sp. TW1]